MKKTRERITVRGIVQGVGFRPFVSRLAERYGFTGWVRNTSEGVLIEIQGSLDQVESFHGDLMKESPPQAHILEVLREKIPVASESFFEIVASQTPSTCETLLSPDLATCADCLTELTDPRDRRKDYPFINCTNCGPRFSIILGVPYDRPFTTMRNFQMCPDCEREYQELSNRRFHAQPNACPQCGPQVEIVRNGENQPAVDPLAEVTECLKRGEIVAIKGVGGFHLACDTTNPDAVKRLRERKGRGDKPLALMVKDLESAERLALVSAMEKEILRSVQAPILLLRPRPNLDLQTWIAPDSPKLGIMLPYSPLHHLICAKVNRPLVMTSGNLSEEPLAFENEDALRRLSQIADLFLTHNRPIARPCDDSVGVVWRDRMRLLRRSRGLVPRPLPLPGGEGIKPFVCLGGDLKNTFCVVTDEGLAFPSQHIGDLESPDSQRSFRAGLRDFCDLLDARPRAVVIDSHPGYHSGRLAREIFPHLPVFAAQHHEAHFAACLAENACDAPAIGIAWDGTGYGADGNLWGGEFFVGDAATPKHAATFRPCRLPGGEKAVYQPWRVAYAVLFDLFGDTCEEKLPESLREIPSDRRNLVKQLLKRGIHCPLCTSVGRIFDGVASLVGLRQTITYEAEAAVALETRCVMVTKLPYPFEIAASWYPWSIDTRPMFEAILDDLALGVDISIISGRFHETLALICKEVCWTLRRETGLNRVALSGGVFQNLVLLDRVVEILESEGFVVLTHSEIPPNDGGISYGQAVVAVARWKQCVWPSP